MLFVGCLPGRPSFVCGLSPRLGGSSLDFTYTLLRNPDALSELVSGTAFRGVRHLSRELNWAAKVDTVHYGELSRRDGPILHGCARYVRVLLAAPWTYRLSLGILKGAQRLIVKAAGFAFDRATVLVQYPSSLEKKMFQRRSSVAKER